MSVTAPAGFRAAGVRAGLKASGRPDLALVVNDGPLDVAAGVFTANRVVAAPVVWSRAAVADGGAHAIILNSGSGFEGSDSLRPIFPEKKFRVDPDDYRVAADDLCVG